MPNSKENLQEAFAGESQASRKYTYFAERADKDGQPQIARLFRAAAEAETVHARNHLNAMNGIGSVADNLKAAIGGEYYEFNSMYPTMIDTAKAEKNSQAEMTFNWANKVENVHHTLYSEALKTLEQGKKAPPKLIYVCQTCGNTVEGDAPDKCPICSSPREKFKLIN
jgi:rubrerythrin